MLVAQTSRGIEPVHHALLPLCSAQRRAQSAPPATSSYLQGIPSHAGSQEDESSLIESEHCLGAFRPVVVSGHGEWKNHSPGIRAPRRLDLTSPAPAVRESAVIARWPGVATANQSLLLSGWAPVPRTAELWAELSNTSRGGIP